MERFISANVLLSLTAVRSSAICDLPGCTHHSGRSITLHLCFVADCRFDTFKLLLRSFKSIGQLCDHLLSVNG